MIINQKAFICEFDTFFRFYGIWFGIDHQIDASIRQTHLDSYVWLSRNVIDSLLLLTNSLSCFLSSTQYPWWLSYLEASYSCCILINCQLPYCHNRDIWKSLFMKSSRIVIYYSTNSGNLVPLSNQKYYYDKVFFLEDSFWLLLTV